MNHNSKKTIMEKESRLIQVWLKSAAAVAVFYAPMALASWTMKFFNTQPANLDGSLIAAALLLVLNVLSKVDIPIGKSEPGSSLSIKKPELGSSLSLMLMVYSAFNLIGGFIPPGSCSLLGVSLAAFVAMMVVRIWLRPVLPSSRGRTHVDATSKAPQVGYWRSMIKHEFKRYSGIVFGVLWLHSASGGLLASSGAVVAWIIICFPWLLNRFFWRESDYTEVPGAKSFVGTLRWSLTLIAAGCLVGVVTGQISAWWFLPIWLCYRPTELYRWTTLQDMRDEELDGELCSAGAAGVAAVLHLWLTHGAFMASLDWTNEALLLICFLFCLRIVTWVVSGGTLLGERDDDNEGLGVG